MHTNLNTVKLLRKYNIFLIFLPFSFQGVTMQFEIFYFDTVYILALIQNWKSIPLLQYKPKVIFCLSGVPSQKKYATINGCGTTKKKRLAFYFNSSFWTCDAMQQSSKLNAVTNYANSKCNCNCNENCTLNSKLPNAAIAANCKCILIAIASFATATIYIPKQFILFVIARQIEKLKRKQN